MFAPFRIRSDSNDIHVVERGHELITVRSSPAVLGAPL